MYKVCFLNPWFKRKMKGKGFLKFRVFLPEVSQLYRRLWESLEKKTNNF